MSKRIAIIGGGIAGITAAWQLARCRSLGADVEVQLFEATSRFGGIIETVHQQGFTIECGPDGWVTEKPWARDLAIELGLAEDLLASEDATRKTHIYLDGTLETMPDGMRMMVPSNLDALDRSHLFSASAKRAYRNELARASELKASAPPEDESIASFTRRHFGEEVLARVAVPLLSGVLGGDVERLSVQAVMPQFVAMERRHGSLIAALQARPPGQSETAIFTTLRTGVGTLIDRLVANTPSPWHHRNTQVESIAKSAGGWQLRINSRPAMEDFDALFLATPPAITRDLLAPVDPGVADLLQMQASSAIVIAFGYPAMAQLSLPPGFGFLVPPASGSDLLACTFVDQKFPGRVPPGARLLRAFFGGASAEALLSSSDEHLAALATEELTSILGPLPVPTLSLVRRWPQSLPQYAVGHPERMAALDRRVAEHTGLTLLGNAYRGVGLPDLIRDARASARRAAEAV